VLAFVFMEWRMRTRRVRQLTKPSEVEIYLYFRGAGRCPAKQNPSLSANKKQHQIVGAVFCY